MTHNDPHPHEQLTYQHSPQSSDGQNLTENVLTV